MKDSADINARQRFIYFSFSPLFISFCLCILFFLSSFNVFLSIVYSFRYSPLCFLFLKAFVILNHLSWSPSVSNHFLSLTFSRIIRPLSLSLSLSLTHTHTLIHIHTHSYTHTHSLSLSHTHTYTHTHIYTIYQFRFIFLLVYFTDNLSLSLSVSLSLSLSLS